MRPRGCPPPSCRRSTSGAIAACDARDGVTDGVIENPPACPFDPGSLQCTGEETDSCLTPSQVGAARKVYGSAVNPRTQEAFFPGMVPGSELTWSAIVGGAQPLSLAVDFYKYFVFSDPNWDWKTMDFDKDIAAGEEKAGKVLDAIDPDLRAFKARGGKLIMYHGWNDQLIPPLNTINYYNSVSKLMGASATDDFARLFMAPGMLHCAGGPGPNTFDALGALEQWVEHGSKPSRSSRRARPMAWSFAPARCVRIRKSPPTRGSGSIDTAANFVCK